MIIQTVITAAGFCILIHAISIWVTIGSLKKDDKAFAKLFGITSIIRFFLVIGFVVAGIKIFGFPTVLFVLSVSFFYILGLIIEIICINIRQKRLNLQLKIK